MADLERIKKKYDTPEIDIEEATNGGNRYSLPYGLCKSVGINTEGMKPREAWDAWTSKTGRTKEDAEREHWGKEASEKNAKKKENELNATEEQRKIIDRFSERLAVGKKGTMKYGGDQSTIVEAPTFSMLENGDIEYRLVGVREKPAIKSNVIGVGDTKASTKTTISTGIIKQDGLIINNRNEVTEETGLKTTDKQPKQEKETPVQENVIKRKEDIKTKDDLISYIKHRHGVELKIENIPFLNDKKNRLYTEIPKENRNSILNDLRQKGFSVEEHNKGYYWIDLPKEKSNLIKSRQGSTPTTSVLKDLGGK